MMRHTVVLMTLAFGFCFGCAPNLAPMPQYGTQQYYETPESRQARCEWARQNYVKAHKNYNASIIGGLLFDPRTIKDAKQNLQRAEEMMAQYCGG